MSMRDYVGTLGNYARNFFKEGELVKYSGVSYEDLCGSARLCVKNHITGYNCKLCTNYVQYCVEI